MAYLAAMLAVYANFITFNFYVAVVISHLAFVYFNERGSDRNFIMRLVKANPGLAKLNVAFIAVTLPFLFLQAATDQFYVGSASIYGTFYHTSLAVLYFKDNVAFLAHSLAILTIGLILLPSAITIRKIVNHRSILWNQVPFIILLVSAGLCIGQHVFLKLPLPRERTAMYFIPLFVISIVFLSLNEISRITAWLKPAIITTALLLTGNFANSMNVRYAANWPSDANVRSVYLYLRSCANKQGVTTVNMDCLLAETMYYYRVANKDSQLHIVSIWPWQLMSQDTNECFYYFFDTADVLLPANTVTLLQFDKEKCSVKQKYGCMP